MAVNGKTISQHNIITYQFVSIYSLLKLFGHDDSNHRPQSKSLLFANYYVAKFVLL